MVQLTDLVEGDLGHIQPAKTRVLVVQDGARHNYGVPLALHGAGVLEAIYIDLCGNKGVGRWLAGLAHLPMPLRIRTAAGRLGKRCVPRDILPYVRTFGWQGLKREWRRMAAVTPEQIDRAALTTLEERGKAMLRSGVGTATHLLTTLGDGGPFREVARLEGLTVVSDVICTLSMDSIIAEEIRKFPDWYANEPLPGAGGDDGALRDRFLKSTDLYLCPSEFVRHDLIVNHGVLPSQTRLVPYGISEDWISIAPEPVRGRILFVGRAWIGKGIHYLAKAANIVNSRGRQLEFRVAGEVAEKVRNHSEARHLRFLGRIARSDIQEEFRRADIFCFPTLAEGSATVTYEAMAAGLPIVTTAAAGSVIRNGRDGIIVPSRSPRALANAILRLCDDRAMREAMSTSGRLHIRNYDWRHYGKRVVAALATPC